MSLEQYRRKRDFLKTPEPAGQKALSRSKKLHFVIQKHDATRLHYDFRLEMDGTLKSWAVPKGPSVDPSEKRLAVHVEDHPLSYASFEGLIPAGQYGGGTVIVWDRGYWIPEADALAAYKMGRLKFQLRGEKLHGGWNLIRMGKAVVGKENWLLIKERDEWAQAGNGDLLVRDFPRSVISNRSLEDVASPHPRVSTSAASAKRTTRTKVPDAGKAASSAARETGVRAKKTSSKVREKRSLQND